VGEDLGDAAAREVFEETGVACDFRSILTFRQQHDMQFGNSDLYFICRMAPRSGGAADATADAAAAALRPCAHEIEEARWMPLAEFEAQNTHAMMAVAARMLGGGATELRAETLHSSVRDSAYKLFYYQGEEEQRL
jgi:8-oxo-dGTP pyrophosphatase MutT (NUDIX family)